MTNKIIYIILAVLILIGWQYFGTTNSTFRLLLSSPSLIVNYFSVNYTDLLLATKITFIEAAAGLLIATIFSFSIMIICFYYPKFMEFVMPIMIASQVIPLIVLAPFFIILLGIGIWSKIAMAALMCFFPIFVNFAQGYKAIDKNIHELIYVYNAKTWIRIKKVYLPLSMPNILAGLKISSTLAVIGAIVAEFAGAETGLGRNLFIAALRLEPELLMTSLLMSIVIGVFLFSIIKYLEIKIIHWQL